MSENWIAQLATEIKQKDREAAEDYARAQHYAGVAAERGREFFLAVIDCLQQYVDALRRELQGDVTAADMRLERMQPNEARITRARFPWVDARLTYSEDAITLDYAKTSGTEGDPQQSRIPRSFVFRVTPRENGEEALRLEGAFEAQPKSYETPEEFARAMMEILFRLPERVDSARADSLNTRGGTADIEAA